MSGREKSLTFSCFSSKKKGRKRRKEERRIEKWMEGLKENDHSFICHTLEGKEKGHNFFLLNLVELIFFLLPDTSGEFLGSFLGIFFER